MACNKLEMAMQPNISRLPSYQGYVPSFRNIAQNITFLKLIYLQKFDIIDKVLTLLVLHKKKF